MKRERLEELRETLSNGDHLTRLDRAHLLALIDAEIARMSAGTTNDEIKEISDLYGDYTRQVVVEIGAKRIQCDYEIATEIARLNLLGINTIASCSGHGKVPASIAVTKECEQAMLDLGYDRYVNDFGATLFRLRQYQKPTDAFCDFPVDEEKEANKKFEERCTDIGVNILDERKQPDTETQQDICHLEIMATNLMGHVQDGNALAIAQVKALDAAITALRQMKPSKWIPVSERLPEPISQTSGANIKNTYLVARYENCNPKGYFHGYQLARYWKSGWGGIDGSYGLSVTHWMPLPEPPKGE